MITTLRRLAGRVLATLLAEHAEAEPHRRYAAADRLHGEIKNVAEHFGVPKQWHREMQLCADYRLVKHGLITEDQFDKVNGLGDYR